MVNVEFFIEHLSNNFDYSWCVTYRIVIISNHRIIEGVLKTVNCSYYT